MQKKSHQQRETQAHTQTVIPSSPLLEESINFLEMRIKKLGDICTELNPYLPVSPDFQKRLREFNIMELEDPFKITNALLKLLEDSVDELHRLRPLSDEEKLKESYR